MHKSLIRQRVHDRRVTTEGPCDLASRQLRNDQDQREIIQYLGVLESYNPGARVCHRFVDKQFRPVTPELAAMSGTNRTAVVPASCLRQNENNVGVAQEDVGKIEGALFFPR